jgi:hypothetical protein
MEINLHKIEEMKISEFADKHGLVMEVRERKCPVGHPLRFYAIFAHTEVKDGCALISTYGNGDCPEQAIKEYAKEIQFQTLVVDAFGPNRREIMVPRLIA